MSSLRLSFITVVLLFFCVLIVLFRGAFLSLFRSSFSWFSHLTSFNELPLQVRRLREENERLRIELQLARQGIVSDDRYSRLQADVFSYYPWNGRRTLMVNKGELEGIKPFMPVLTDSGFLLGKVNRVWRTRSEVVTIFDPQWKSSVQIGELRVKGVLQGGASLSVDLIPLGARLRASDTVTNISPDFPLALPLGFVASIVEKTGSSFQKALLESAFVFEDITSVFVITDFP